MFLVLFLFLSVGSGSILSTFDPNHLNIKLRESGCAVRESIDLLKNNFIHRHKYSTETWKALEKSGLRRNDTHQGMAEIIANLNDPYTRHLPQTSMITKSNQIRGLTVGTGLRVKRMWDMIGFTSQLTQACSNRNLLSGWPKLASCCAIVAPSVLWACHSKGIAVPAIASSLAAVSAGCATWLAYPYLFPLKVCELHPDLALSDAVRIGDQIMTVNNKNIAHSSAERVQGIVNGDSVGETVQIVLRRWPSKHPPSTQVSAGQFTPSKSTVHPLQRLSMWVGRVRNKIKSKILGENSVQHPQPSSPSVTVLQQHPDGTTELQVELTKTHLLADSTVEASVLPLRHCGSKGVGLIRIPEFTDETYFQVCNALNSLKGETIREQNCSLQALVMDLRGNQGGPVAPALDIAALFLPKGTVLTQLCANQRTEKHYSTNQHADQSTPLLLLTDARTASSGEILIEALCDNNRAVSLGTHTVGKNVAQAVMTLSDGSGLCFSVLEFRSPTGRFMGEGHLPRMYVPAHKDVQIRSIKFDAHSKTFNFRQ